MLTLDLWLCRTGPNRRSARYNRDELAPSHRLLQKGPTALFSTLATKGIELANHRGFFEAGKRLLKRARFARQPMALIMFDLDRFKSINDRYGHHTGDEVLTAFCQLASSQLRPNDLFGRIGGRSSRACCQTPGTMTPFGAPSGCAARSKPLSHTFGRHGFGSTVSVGIAITDSSDLSALLNAADQALYRAKVLGRNRAEPPPHWAKERSTKQRTVAI
jgi:diguanylate cyclase (GGDEF)-like protein